MSLSRTNSLPLHHPTLPTNSLGLALLPIIRYGSFGSRRIRLKPSLNAAFNNSQLIRSTPKVPIEILEHIIEHYANIILAPSLASRAHVGSQKSAFKRFFGPCTLVSKAFRHLSLRAFFRSVGFNTTDDSSSLLNFLDLVNARYLSDECIGGYRWVRSLSSPSFLIPPNISFLRNMAHLRGLHVDFSHSGLALQRSCLRQLFSSLADYHTMLNLTSLKLTELPRIDHHMLSLVGTGLPNLVDVQFTSTDGLDMECCPNCYEDSLTLISHSPVSDLYSDVICLADAFGRALAPLKNLNHVFFGIFLSPSNLLDSHINHSWKEAEMKPTTVETIYNCSRCARYEKSTKQKELLASLIIAHHIESLRGIGWASPFGNPCQKIIKDTRLEEGSNGENDNVVDVVQGRGDRAADVRAYSDFATNLLGAKEGRMPLRSPCTCSGHGLKTTLHISRSSGKIRVARAL